MFTVKKIGFTILSLFILGLIGLVAIVLFVDPNQYKDKISHLVVDKTGRPLTIAGDLSWTLTPWLALNIQDMTLGNPKGFKGDFLYVQQAHVEIPLLKLIAGHLDISGLTLKNFKLHLQTNKKGQVNWSLDPSQTIAPEDAPSPQHAPAKTSKPSSRGMTLYDLAFKEGQIIWEDAPSNTTYRFEHFALSVDKLSLLSGLSTPIAMSTEFYSEPSPIKKPIQLKGKAKVDLGKQRIELINFQTQLEELMVQTNASINMASSTPTLSGKVSIPSFSPQALIQTLNINSQEHLPKKLAFDASIEANETGFDISNLLLAIDKGELKGNIKGGFDQKTPGDFSLKAHELDLDKLIYFVAALSASPELLAKTDKSQKPAAPQQSSASKESFTIPPQFKQLKLSGDFTGDHITLQNNTIEKLTFKMNAQQGVIDFSPIQMNLYKTAPQARLTLNLSQQVPIISLKATVDSFEMNDLLTGLGHPKKLYGSSSFQTELQTTGANPDALKRNLNGHANVHINQGSFVGADLVAMLDELKLAVKDIITGIKEKKPENLAVMLANGQSALKSHVDPSTHKKTAFDSLRAHTTIKKGVLDNRDLLVQHPKYKITGQGTVNLVTELVNYQASCYLTQSEKEDDIKEFLKETPVTVNITGAMQEPKVDIDTDGFMKAAMRYFQKTLLKKATTKIIDKILGSDKGDDGEGIGSTLEKALGDIFR